jgi:hypothetical protein
LRVPAFFRNSVSGKMWHEPLLKACSSNTFLSYIQTHLVRARTRVLGGNKWESHTPGSPCLVLSKSDFVLNATGQSKDCGDVLPIKLFHNLCGIHHIDMLPLEDLCCDYRRLEEDI